MRDEKNKQLKPSNTIHAKYFKKTHSKSVYEEKASDAMISNSL
jgi:hypothetical protein